MNISAMSILLILLSIVPLARHFSYVKITAKETQTAADRYRYYFENMARILLVTAAIMGLVFYFRVPVELLGFRAVSFGFLQQQYVLVNILLFVFMAWYCFYMYYVPLIGIRQDAYIRSKAMPVLKAMNYLAPKSSAEVGAWILYAVASSAEEIIYRGFIFFFVAQVVGVENLGWAVVASMLVESAQHLPRVKIIPYVMCTSLFFSLLYLYFDSIIVVMLLKCLHYLKVLAMPFDYLEIEKLSLTPEQQCVEELGGD
jgi:membrane protease YdiL (CAAX protease family)